jgi:hypothetical protein
MLNGKPKKPADKVQNTKKIEEEEATMKGTKAEIIMDNAS